jgi:sugar phosphate isomerase/epimerase
MRSAITVSLVPQAAGGPFVFWNGLTDACESASALGFDAIEIFPPSADGIDRDELRALLAKHNLTVAAIGSGAGWVVKRLTLTHADPVIRETARAFVKAIVDLAAEFGAPAILGSMQGRWEGDVTRDQALAWLGPALEDLGDHSARLGVPFLYEPLNRYETNIFNRIGDTAAWLRTLRTKNVRILADLFHMNIEEADIATAFRDNADLIGHVHFADSNRRAVGFGHTDIREAYDALDKAGYDGFLSAEILPFPDAETAAAESMRSFQKLTR